MNLKGFEGLGSTPIRRKFWGEVHKYVLGARKLAGRHVKVREHPGKGTIIDLLDDSARGRGGGPPVPVGACCAFDECVILSEAVCGEVGGDYQGDNTTCSPNPCPTPPETGACCDNDCGCTETILAECTGTWRPGVSCDPNPCAIGWFCSGYVNNSSSLSSDGATCTASEHFYEEHNCFGGPATYHFCSGNEECINVDCHITKEWQLSGDLHSCTLVETLHEPPGCTCGCPSCACASEPCCIDTSHFDACGDSGGISYVIQDCECDNGNSHVLEITTECHYTC